TDITSLTNNVSYRLSFSLCQSFFINGTATTDIYTLSLHDALPILGVEDEGQERFQGAQASQSRPQAGQGLPRSEEEHLPPRRRSRAARHAAVDARPQDEEAELPPALDRPHQRSRAPERYLLLPVDRRAEQGRLPARPQGAGRHRALRSQGLRGRRRGGPPVIRSGRSLDLAGRPSAKGVAFLFPQGWHESLFGTTGTHRGRQGRGARGDRQGERRGGAGEGAGFGARQERVDQRSSPHHRQAPARGAQALRRGGQ